MLCPVVSTPPAESGNTADTVRKANTLLIGHLTSLKMFVAHQKCKYGIHLIFRSMCQPTALKRQPRHPRRLLPQAEETDTPTQHAARPTRPRPQFRILAAAQAGTLGPGDATQPGPGLASQESLPSGQVLISRPQHHQVALSGDLSWYLSCPVSAAAPTLTRWQGTEPVLRPPPRG